MAKVVDVRNSGGNLVIVGGSLTLPTSDYAVATPAEGSIRYNVSSQSMELYTGSDWIQGAGGGGGGVQISRVAAIQGGTEWTDASVDDTVNNSLNSRVGFYTPNRSAISDIVVTYPGWYLNPAEADQGTGSLTFEASIEYPAGTITQLFTSTGGTQLVVPVGRTNYSFAPCPLVIPPGTQFWLKTYVKWTTGHFHLYLGRGSTNPNDWTNVGVNLASSVLNTTTFTSTYQFGGYTGQVFGRLKTPTACLGIHGDSISAIGGQPDPRWASCGATWMGEAMRGEIPVLSLSAAGDSITTATARSQGRQGLFSDKITHLIYSLIRNDLNGGTLTLAQLQALLQKGIAPYLARGVKVWTVTCMPSSSSTNGFIDQAGQTAAASQALRNQYNAWIRANWASLGISGLLDFSAIMDPTNVGKWRSSGLAVTNQGRAAITLTGGKITAAGFFNYNGNNSSGNGYALGLNLPAIVLPFPGDPGKGAILTAVINATTPRVASWTITNSGSGYVYPPMVFTDGTFTTDGIHPSNRSLYQMIYDLKIRPEMFLD